MLLTEVSQVSLKGQTVTPYDFKDLFKDAAVTQS